MVLCVCSFLLIGCVTTNTNNGESTMSGDVVWQEIVETGEAKEITGDMSDTLDTGDVQEVVVGEETELSTGDVDLTGEDLEMFNEVWDEIMGTMEEGLEE